MTALTEMQIEQGWRDTFSTGNPYCPCDRKSFAKAVRWAERALLAAAPAAPAQSEPDCWAILTPNGSRLVSPDEAKGRRDAYPLYTAHQVGKPEPQEPYLYIYEYDSAFGLHREFSPREWNAMQPTRTVPLYAAPPAQTAGMERAPRDDMVICPACVHQFRAIPVDVQKQLAERSVETSAVAGVFKEISAERARQDVRWGGATHDDEHSTEDFFSYMRRQMSAAGTEASSIQWNVSMMREAIDEIGPKTRAVYRGRLVKIAALAVAGIESLDRKGVKS